jgi:hypothetical protein
MSIHLTIICSIKCIKRESHAAACQRPNVEYIIDENIERLLNMRTLNSAVLAALLLTLSAPSFAAADAETSKHPEVKPNSVVKVFARKFPEPISVQPGVTDPIVSAVTVAPSETASAPAPVEQNPAAKPTLLDKLANAGVTAEAMLAKEQELKGSVYFDVRWKSGKDGGYAELATLLLTKASIGTTQERLNLTCTVQSAMGSMVIGRDSRAGFEGTLFPTEITEEGVNVLVDLSYQNSQVNGAQSLSQNCAVFEQQGLTSSMVKVANLSWDQVTTFVLKDGTEVQITAHQKREGQSPKK